ncbi:MAG: stage V sporulation protein D [Clostridiales bacterium]|nr:stage V sporulation protein D [Clostridiales bacterium]MBQ2769255.1 stage V sporulation protein D [Clostridia bacterium]
MTLCVRFFYVQVLWSEELNYRALDQWTREIPIVAKRGKITDRNGVVLADNETAYTVFARSNAVKDKQKTAALLAEALGQESDGIYEKLTKKKASEITVAKKVGKEAIENLSSLSLDGVYYSRDNLRYYPKGDALCQVIGFTSSDNAGTTGVEKYYDEYLSGKNGELLYETDLVGIEIEGSVATYLPAENGYNLQLTIDYGIQELVESALEKTAAQYSPVSAECIVLDVNTFEVLALANYPAYDLNEVPREDTELLNSLTRNRMVSDVYEPGSTFKIVTAAADIEEYLRGNKNAFATNYVFNSSRTRSVDGTTVKCWSNHANGKHSNQTLAEALNNSCNPCFTDIAMSLGKEKFYEYLSAFGFGKRTGLDFSGEAYGLLMPESAVRGCDLARIGFGQTIAVSGIQLACAAASAINGGYYYAPRLVKKVYADDGYVLKNYEPQLKNRPISTQASKILAEMLEGVVRDGSGKKAYIEGYRVGGKTGTAQKFENGHIAAGKYVSSFVGFFPADAPKYLALVIVDEPQGAYYGSVVAAPCAGEIFQGIISLKNIQKRKGE